jgi:hypothetical protein
MLFRHYLLNLLIITPMSCNGVVAIEPISEAAAVYNFQWAASGQE